MHLYDVSLYQMNLTLTVYFVLTGIGTLSYLKLSKILSSENICILSMMIFIIGAIVISLSDSYPFILFGRAIQGFGYGLIQNNVTNFIRVMDSQNYAKNTSYMVQSCEILCFISPLLGVFLFEKASWNAPFLFIATSATFLLLVTQRIFKQENLSIQKNDDSSFKENLSIILHRNFLVYLIVCALMNATIWALISISPYYIEGKSFSEGSHAIFYTLFSAFYISGSFCFEKVEGYTKFHSYATGMMTIAGLGLIGSMLVDSAYAFMFFVCFIGFLSGLLYGFVISNSQEKISSKNERARKLATTLLLVSRLIGSGIMTAFISWLFKVDQELSIMVCGGIVVFTSYLLFVGKQGEKLVLIKEKG